MHFVLIWFICGIIAAMIGSKNGETGLAFLMGVLFGPFGFLFVILSKGNRRNCPYCMEIVHKNARLCPHCRKDLS